MALSKMESDKQILLLKLPELVWEKVFRCNIIPKFPSLATCYEASDFFQNLIDNSGQLWITPDKIVPHSYCQQNGSWTLTLGANLASVIELKPRITIFKIFVMGKFRADSKLINALLESQRNTLQTFHISSCEKLLNYRNPTCLELPEMNRLRDLTIDRFKSHTGSNSISVQKSVLLPMLETLTLSTASWDDWSDLILFPSSKFSDRHPLCDTVKHLSLHPSAIHWSIQHTIHNMSRICSFPNVVSLQISAIYLNRICSILPAPGILKQLTLTAPHQCLFYTKGSLTHKFVFDMCITGYSTQMCAGNLQNPDRAPQHIWEDIETGILEPVRAHEDIMYDDIYQPPKGANRHPGISIFHGLEELKIKNDTHLLGPTLVSCPDLLSMRSLKLLQFCGHKPKYIPDDMISKMRERFKVRYAKNTTL